jgi:hypothetical protein
MADYLLVLKVFDRLRKVDSGCDQMKSAPFFSLFWYGGSTIIEAPLQQLQRFIYRLYFLSPDFHLSILLPPIKRYAALFFAKTQLAQKVGIKI